MMLTEVLAVAGCLLALVAASPIDTAAPHSDQPFNRPMVVKFDCSDQFVEGAINVHVIPHTHDDPGWLKTVDQYYIVNNGYSDAGPVQYILNTVVRELLADPAKRFSYCEMSYFMRWWDEQTNDTKTQVTQLVQQERLQFVGGGWVQSDEAASHYAAFIDQMTYGLGHIRRLFGERALPVAAWQIDPFGHSRGIGELFHRMGFEALYFARLHYLDYDKRRRLRRIIMNWDVCPADTCASPASLLTSHFYEYGYGAPGDLCWDQSCNDDPIQDDPRLEAYNVPDEVDYIMDYIQQQVHGLVKHQVVHVLLQAISYKNDHVMFLMGDDFNYENANKYFTNMDKMIKYTNERGQTSRGTKVNMFYSTPNCYTRGLQLHNTSFWGQPKTDDFFPYASDPVSYWGGYFTSRPTFKGYIRSSNNLLQQCKAVEALAAINNMQLRNSSETMARAVALTQHHDAVTGTAKQHVTDDYMKRLYEGQQECQALLREGINRLSQGELDYALCPLVNVSVCDTAQSGSPFIVAVFNRLAHPHQYYVRLPLNQRSGIIFNDAFAPQRASLVESFPPQNDSQLGFVDGRSPYELQIPVTLQPLGSTSFFVIPFADDDEAAEYPAGSTFSLTEPKLVETKEPSPSAEPSKDVYFSIKSNHFKLSFNAQCQLIQMQNVTSMQQIDIGQTYLWYKSASDSDPDNKRASGAYVFRPEAANKIVYPVEGSLGPCYVVQNQFVAEVRQMIGNYVSNIFRLWTDKPYVEVEWVVGPLPRPLTRTGHEVIMRYDTNINNQKQFYTDANGRQQLQRVRDHQDTYDYDDTQPSAGNYYPVDTRIAIQDNQNFLGVLTDRSHGGSSLEAGQMEVMVHRRCFYDDGFGVGEPLDELGPDGRGLVVKGRSWLVLEPVAAAASRVRPLLQQMFQQPLQLFAPSYAEQRSTVQQQMKNLRFGAEYSLPDNVNLLSLERFDDGRTLIRLEHMYGVNEDPGLSRPALVNIRKLFPSASVHDCEELDLAAVRHVDSGWQRTSVGWQDDVQPSAVLLQPFQIRTFACRIQALNRYRS